jgi:sorbose reductase
MNWLTVDEFGRIFEVNTYGPYYFARALVRSWLGLPVDVDPLSLTNAVPTAKKLGKQILFISSISGLVAMKPQRQAAYNASKGALTMLSKVSGLEATLMAEFGRRMGAYGHQC